MWGFIQHLAALQPQPTTRRGHHQPATCRSLAGGRTAWWLILKYPHSYSYAYLDAEAAASCGAGPCWSEDDVIHGLLNGTLWPLRTDASLGYLMYNDEDPGGTEHFTFGHQKGILFLDAHAGVFVQHSAPQWPRSPDSGDDFSRLHQPQSVYGQHFFCVALAGDSMESLAGLLAVSRPHIHAFRMPPKLAEAYPNVARLASGHWDARTNASAVTLPVLPVLGSLVLVAKSPHLHIPLHEALLEPLLRAPMAWETWRLGRGALPSACPPAVMFAALNVQRVRFPAGEASINASWRTTEDHSKWGVSLAEAPPAANNGASAGSAATRKWSCLCDLNREAGQMYRGGACVCSSSASLWQALSRLVDATEQCDDSAQNWAATAA